MAVWKIVISDPKTRKAFQLEVEKEKASILIGKKIGDKIDGSIIGLPNYVLMITGGTDKDGFPMHPSIEGIGKKRILLKGPPCFHPRKKGEGRRKMVRGNTISMEITQINMKVVKSGEKPLEELIPKKS